MKNKKARFIFLGICLVLAALLLTHVISPITSGILFAISLIALGLIPKSDPK
jgi:hypothetical protein